MSESTDRPEFLNLRQLHAWLTIVEEGSVTAAARRLDVSQPALSQQLRALEEQFGGPLLERLPRGVKASALGRALLGDARATLAAATRLTRQARSIARLEAGVLEIATLPSLVDSTLLEPIRRWNREHANVAIRLLEFAQQDVMTENVAMGVGDVAIGVRPRQWAGPVVSLGWEEFVVLLPPEDPLAGSRKPVKLSALRDRNWVLYERANGLSDYVLAACAEAGFSPREAVSTSQVQAAIRLARAGLGPVLVPSANVPAELADHARPLSPHVVWELTAFTRAEFSPSVEAFIGTLPALVWDKRPRNAIELPAG